MYIDKLQPFWTEEELRKAEEYRERDAELQERLKVQPMLTEGWYPLVEEQERLRSSERSLYESVRKRYTLSFYKRPNKIFDDVKEIAEATTKEEFIAHINTWREIYSTTISALPNDALNYWYEKFDESYENFEEFIEERLQPQRHVIDYYGLPMTRYTAIIEKAVKRYYKKKQPAYLPLMQANATNALAESSAKGFIPDPITGRTTQTVNGITITAEKGTNLRQASQAIKLMDLLVLKLGTIVPFQATPEEILKSREMPFSVAEYMEMRKLSDAKNARAQFIEGLKFLYSISLDWEELRYFDFTTGEHLRKPERKKWHTRILDSIGEDFDKPIKRGTAELRFNPDIVTYLSYGYIMPTPTFLFQINERQYPYAYLMGRKLALHKNTNIGKPWENRMAVVSLLEIIPDIPTYEEVIASNDRHVRERIIKPFETSLSGLELGMKWHYLNSLYEPITQEQRDNCTYADWITWYVEFEFIDYPDTTERLEEKEKKIEASKKKKEKREKKRAEKEAKRG